jgi:hypothetical protein
MAPRGTVARGSRLPAQARCRARLHRQNQERLDASSAILSGVRSLQRRLCSPSSDRTPPAWRHAAARALAVRPRHRRAARAPPLPGRAVGTPVLDASSRPAHLPTQGGRGGRRAEGARAPLQGCPAWASLQASTPPAARSPTTRSIGSCGVVSRPPRWGCQPRRSAPRAKRESRWPSPLRSTHPNGTPPTRTLQCPALLLFIALLSVQRSGRRAQLWRIIM